MSSPRMRLPSASAVTRLSCLSYLSRGFSALGVAVIVPCMQRPWATNIFACLQQQAGGLYEVTVARLKASARCKASVRKVLCALHAHGMCLRPMPETLGPTYQAIDHWAAFAGSGGSSWR